MKMTKIAAIVAAAALLIIGAAFTSMAADLGWQMEDGQWVYLDADGERYADCFKKSADGNQYWLDSDGFMATDLLIEDNGLYYVDANGVRVSNAWAKIYNEDDDASYWYFFGSNGKAYVATEGNYDLKSVPVSTGATEKAKFVFGTNGRLVTGFMGANYEPCGEDDDAADCTYYAGGEDDGIVRMNKWEELTYDDNGDEKTGWFFFKKTTGAKATSGDTDGIKWNKVTYTFDSKGVMNSGSWGKNSEGKDIRYDASGAVIKSAWFKTTHPGYDEDAEEFEEFWYYAGKDGAIYTAKIAKINNKFYGFGKDGKMLTGLQNIIFNGEDIATASAVNSWTGIGTGVIDITPSATANGYYYFGSADDADTDGAMKTGTSISVTVDDETKTMGFEASGEYKGVAMNGYNTKAKAYYKDGIKIAADEDSKYILLGITTSGNTDVTATVVDAKTYLDKNAVVTKADSKDTELVPAGERVGRGKVGVAWTEDTKKQGSFKANGIIDLTAGETTYDHILCINQSGNVVGSGVKTDGNDYKFYVNSAKEVTGVYYLF